MGALALGRVPRRGVAGDEGAALGRAESGFISAALCHRGDGVVPIVPRSTRAVAGRIPAVYACVRPRACVSVCVFA